MKAVFFDLDGTLIGMDMETFVMGYLKELCKMAAPLGYEAKALNDAMWACTGAMIKNDGSVTNKERFWTEFAKFFGADLFNVEFYSILDSVLNLSLGSTVNQLSA